MAELMTKGEFAQLIGVSAGRVSQMIAAGQIDGAAIDGEGQRAKIRPDLAREQLRRRRDVGQTLGNGLATNLDDDRRALPPAAAPAAYSPAPAASRRDVFDDAIRAEKLRGLRAANRRALELERERAGLYVRSDQTAAAMAKLATMLLTVVESGLGEMSQAIAAKFQLPARDVTHLLRAEFTALRARAAERTRDQALAVPALLDDETPDPSDPAAGRG